MNLSVVLIVERREVIAGQQLKLQIIKFVNEKKKHVPPISEGVIYFPYEIAVAITKGVHQILGLW